MKKEDIRVTKSKRDLCNALSALMLTTPFEKITVGAICDKAMINRMTFYKHYKDKYELMNDLLLNIKQSVRARVESATPAVSIKEDAYAYTSVLVDAVVNECVERKDFITAVNNSELVLTMISTTIGRAVSDLLAEFGKTYSFRFDTGMLSAAITGAAAFLIRHWLYHFAEETKDRFLTKIKEFFKVLFDSEILFS